MSAETVQLRQRFGAPLATLWAAWTKPALLAQWWAAGPSYQPGRIEVDLRVGGRFHLEMREVARGSARAAVGAFIEIEKQRRLALSWVWEEGAAAGESRIGFEFQALEAGSELVLVHDGSAERDWTLCLQSLRVRLLVEAQPRVQPLLQQLRHHRLLVAAILDGVEPGSARQAPFVGGNSLHWLLGHLVTTRQAMALLVGARVERPWVEHFGLEAKGREPRPQDWPTLDELQRSWDLVDGILRHALGELGAEALAQPSPYPFANPVNDIGNGLAFLAMHEAYHIGQLMIARRALGLPRPASLP